jgi:hypothetical protein
MIARFLLLALLLTVSAVQAAAPGEHQSTARQDASRGAGHLRKVDIRVLRPSQDLGELANEYEPRLPAGFRYLTRSLGTKESEPSDLLSMVMFQQDYLQRLIELGEADTQARIEELRELVEGDGKTARAEP